MTQERDYNFPHSIKQLQHSLYQEMSGGAQTLSLFFTTGPQAPAQEVVCLWPEVISTRVQKLTFLQPSLSGFASKMRAIVPCFQFNLEGSVPLSLAYSNSLLGQFFLLKAKPNAGSFGPDKRSILAYPFCMSSSSRVVKIKI